MPSAATSLAPSSGSSVTRHSYAIVGTGFAGLGMAIELKKKGREDFIILERAEDVGGTWRDNHYPGAACDVPSHLYSFSFEPNCDWSRVYPTQPELKRYLREVAEKWDLLPHIRFGHQLNAAHYCEHSQRWQLETTGGNYNVGMLISGNGGLAEPRLPDIPGVERFAGKCFHSANWDHSYDLRGKRVAVIGTGASAIQFVPEIADQPAQLDVYQRTPNWIIPRKDRPYSELEKAAFRYLPGVRLALRSKIYCHNETRILGMVLHPSLMKLYERMALQHIRSQVKSPALRERVTPSYPVGCKRVLISNDWYPALQRPNVSLLSDGIQEIREHSIVDANGTEREVDCVIFGTGFYATENPIAQIIHGRGGQSLAEAWRDGEEAYLGTTVNGFPNLMLIVGPNVTLGHSSMVYMIETQIQAISRLLDECEQRHCVEVEVREAVQKQFNRALHKRLDTSIWATGCDSWYKHRSGKITQLWPDFTFRFRAMHRRFTPDDYQFSPASAAHLAESHASPSIN